MLFTVACNRTPTADAGRDVFVPRTDAQDAGTDVGFDTSVPDVPPLPYDAGPPPTCVVVGSTRRVLDHPGGSFIASPSGLVRTTEGYLIAYRHTEGTIPITRDTTEVVALGTDGTPRSAARVLLESSLSNTVSEPPTITPTTRGAFVTIQRSRPPASSPTFVLELQAATVDEAGGGTPASLFRDRYSRALMATLAQGGILGLSTQITGGADAGAPVAAPATFFAEDDGGVRGPDQRIVGVLPDDRFDSILRSRDDSGAVLIYRTSNLVGFAPFARDGGLDPRIRTVLGASIPTLDDADISGGSGVAAWSRTVNGGVTEVHAVVFDLASGRLRSDLTLETYQGEGFTKVTAMRSWGGVALFWPRGVDRNARVRVAVVSPDGQLTVPPSDLVAAPGIEGKLAVEVQGREVAFVTQDGLTESTWGFTFGRACIPAR